jgi:tetratricopeptide (TPR) repeat protein
VATCFAIPKSSAKRDLQRLVRLPRVDFPIPLQFDHRLGFIAFPEPSSAANEAGRLLKHVKGLPDEAPLYLAAARIFDAQGDMSGALRHYSAAIEMFRRKLEINPRDAKSMAGLGDALVSLGRYAEAKSILDRALEQGGGLEAQLALSRYHRERAWFTAAGEAQRYSPVAFLDKLISMVAAGPEPAQLEASKKFLAEAERSISLAFDLEGDKADRLLERATFRAFRRAMETAFTQIQGGDLRSRSLRLSIYDADALADLHEAALLSREPSTIAASALAAALAAEVEPIRESAAQSYVRTVANQLREIAGNGSESAFAAAEYLGSLQFHLLKDPRGAQRTLRKALEYEPRRYRSWELLTLASAYSGAEDFVETAEERVNVLPTARSSVLLVKSYDLQGDYLRAEWTALNAASSYPNDFHVNLCLAAALLKDPDVANYLWRINEALTKAEKALGPNPNLQNRTDFVLVKSIYLGISDQAAHARALLQTLDTRIPEVQEILRLLED